MEARPCGIARITASDLTEFMSQSVGGGFFKDHTSTAARCELKPKDIRRTDLAFFHSMGLAALLIVALLALLNEGRLLGAGREEIQFHFEFASLLVGGRADEPDAFGGLACQDDMLADHAGERGFMESVRDDTAFAPQGLQSEADASDLETDDLPVVCRSLF